MTSFEFCSVTLADFLVQRRSAPGIRRAVTQMTPMARKAADAQTAIFVTLDLFDGAAPGRTAAGVEGRS
jgi:hypothetical protein